MKCPNCGRNGRKPKAACLLEAVAGILVARGHSATKVMGFLADVDPDSFWELVGPIADSLENDMAVAAKGGSS